MIGQKKLLQKLNNFTQSSLPHSILLLGERGSEQLDVCEFISNKFNLELNDVTEIFDKNIVDQIQQSTTLSLYVIDMNKINDTKEMRKNALLKLFEEPSQYAYIIIIAENEEAILDTIKTRSYVLRMDTYKETDLLELVVNKSLEETQLILSIAHTPGQVELANHCDVLKMKEICDNLKVRLPYMKSFEVLKISDMINFTDMYDKLDLYLFTKMLKETFRDNYKLYRHLHTMTKYINEMAAKIGGQQRYFDHCMLDLWKDSLQSL